MDKKDFESLLNKYPDCVSDGKKLKAFLKDLFPDVPKAIVNTLTIMADDGIISEMQKAGQTPLVSARLQKKLEDDYGLSQKIIAECYSLVLQESVKQTEVASGLVYDPNEFVIKNGVLIEYNGTKSSVVIPDCVMIIGEYAFSNCTELTSVTIPDSVTNIEYEAFSGCTSLTSVTIPDSVTSISNFAFHDCTGLTSITIPNSVTIIGPWAFEGCTGLTSVTIPGSVTSIGDSAFYNCTGLTSIIVEEGNTKYHSAGNCLIETATKTLVLGCKTSVIPTDGSVTSIGSSAFQRYGKLQDIYITDIAAWCNISGLDKLMYDGSSNKKLYINNELATSITIPNGVTAIPSSAFSGCSGLTSVTIPNSVKIIGYAAFSSCYNLQNIYITDIAAWCNISGLYNLMEYGASNRKLYINNELATSITIPNGVTAIPSCAFSGCTGLTSVTIPNSVTSIGYSAFYGCTRLTSITIPNSVTSIGGQAFYNTAWYNNQPDGLVYAGKVAYDYKGTMPSSTSIVLKEGTLGIASCAFYGCEGLTSITIPNSVTSIGFAAFSNCPSLTSITILDSVTSIGPGAFRDCTGLTSVTIPGSVTSIGDSAFNGCTGLTSVTIGNSVTNIGDEAFSGCKNLTIYCEAKSKPIGWSSYWNSGHRPVVWGVKK